MFRKLLIATVASLSLLASLAIPAQTEAREVVHARAHVRYHGRAHVRYHGRAHVRYHSGCRVLFRSCSTGTWQLGGMFSCHADAVHAMTNYQQRGYQACIR